MRVLLTGASGFLGQNLLPKLRQYYSTYGISSKDADLRKQSDCKKIISKFYPDVIVHAAGSVGGIGANRDNPGKFMYDNLIMGANLIEEARHQGS